jgi:dUTP pyrophosphatase
MPIDSFFDLQIKTSPGTCAQLLSRSGMALKHWADVKAVVIDSDFTGNVQVLLHNQHNEAYDVHIGDHIAQLVPYDIATPNVVNLNHTT